MGGHTIAKDGYVIDCGKLNSMSCPDEATGDVTVGPGTQWHDLIRHLNAFGRSPMTLQSYSTFSVGGSVSVNAHGITNDSAMYAF
jgi:FAD/FMN-containing dehydrogenase